MLLYYFLLIWNYSNVQFWNVWFLWWICSAEMLLLSTKFTEMLEGWIQRTCKNIIYWFRMLLQRATLIGYYEGAIPKWQNSDILELINALYSLVVLLCCTISKLCSYVDIWHQSTMIVDFENLQKVNIFWYPVLRSSSFIADLQTLLWKATWGADHGDDVAAVRGS
jgi:hypothetical protein